MQPFEPPPPQKSGPSAAIIVLVVLGVLAILLSLVVVGGVYAYRKRRAAAQRVATATDAALTQTYASKNGLVVAHYPADFAAKNLDHATLLIARTFPDGTDEAVLVAGVSPPITDDVEEFSRILINAMVKNIQTQGDTWTETARRRRPCFKAFPGLEVRGTFTAQKVTKENVWMCFFIDSNRGYELKSIVPAVHEPADRATLRAILEATEVK
jgi:type II secretory pathway pseudopilin PulG